MTITIEELENMLGDTRSIMDAAGVNYEHIKTKMTQEQLDAISQLDFKNQTQEFKELFIKTMFTDNGLDSLPTEAEDILELRFFYMGAISTKYAFEGNDLLRNVGGIIIAAPNTIKREEEVVSYEEVINNIKKQLDSGINTEEFANLLKENEDQLIVGEVANHWSSKKPPIKQVHTLLDLLNNVKTKDIIIKSYLENPENKINHQEFKTLSERMDNVSSKETTQKEWLERNPKQFMKPTSAATINEPEILKIYQTGDMPAVKDAFKNHIILMDTKMNTERGGGFATVQNVVQSLIRAVNLIVRRPDCYETISEEKSLNGVIAAVKSVCDEKIIGGVKEYCLNDVKLRENRMNITKALQTTARDNPQKQASWQRA